jgi:hypothetical protein
MEGAPENPKTPERISRNEAIGVQAVRAGQRMEDTKVLEAGLEERKKPSRLNKFLKVAAASIALTTGSIATKKGIDSYVEHKEREETRALLIEKTGCDLVEIAEKAGFKVILEVDNGKGKYVAHVGHTHYDTTNMSPDSLDVLKEIVGVQKGVDFILVSLPHTEGTTPFVFSESIVEEENPQAIFQFHKSLLSEISPQQGSILKVLDIYEEEVVKRHINNYPHIQNVFNYIYKQKMKELLDYYTTNPGLYEPTVLNGKQFTSPQQEYDFVSSNMSNRFDVLGDDAVYISGADLKLAADGKIVIFPAETVQGNSEAIKVARRGKSAVYDGDKGALSFIEFEHEYEKKVKEEREDIGLGLIGQRIQNGEISGQLIPIQFGVGHQFKNNVETFNAMHPDMRLGLIRFEHMDAGK